MVSENEKKTPVFDWEKGDFVVDPQRRVVTVTETKALEQVVIKAQQTVRAVFLLYADNEDPENNHIYGSDAGEILTQADLTDAGRLSELERAIKEAVIYDPWVRDIYDIKVSRKGTDEAVAEFTVDSIFGEIRLEGVSITNGG